MHADDLRPALRLGGLIGLWLGGLWLAYHAGSLYLGQHALGQDAHAYWLTAHRADLYGAAPDTKDAYLYSPAFAQLIHPLALLPWPVFYAVWASAELAAFVWLLRPLGWTWAPPLLLLCVPELLVGNVVGFIAVAAVLGMTRPGFWAAPLLTKVTLGGVGATWFVVRRDWRAAGVAAVWTAGIVAVSAALAPGDWQDWIAFLRDHPSGRAVLVRVALGLLVVAIAAWRGWWWAIPIALIAVTPVLNASQPLAYLTALARLRVASSTGGVRSALGKWGLSP